MSSVRFDTTDVVIRPKRKGGARFLSAPRRAEEDVDSPTAIRPAIHRPVEQRFGERADDEGEETISLYHSQVKTKLSRMVIKSKSQATQAQIDETNFLELLDLDKQEQKSLTKLGEDAKTIIHQVVEGAKSDNARIRLLLVRHVLQKVPELLKKRDKNERTPLHACIADGRQVLLDYMLTEHPKICKSILNERGAKASKTSCLHEAITQRMEDCAAKMLELLEPHALKFTDAEGNTPLHVSVDPFLWPDWSTPEEAQCRERFVQRLLDIDRDNAALATRNKDGQTPFQYHLSKLKELESQEDAVGRNTFKRALLNDEAIHFRLLDACMHWDSVTDIKRVLYGGTGGRMISFNLSEIRGRREPLPEDYLTCLNHVNLEHILKFVYLPSLETHQEPILETSANLSSAPSAARGLPAGSKMMSLGQIFDWLWGRDVWKIVKVIVRDDEDAPHGDEDIEKALERFYVEILDWRKLDISSETIFTAAPHLREVVLYTRAQRAVLWGWSAPDGLVKLKELRIIHLIVTRPIERKEQVIVYIEEFQRRLKGNLGKREIRINVTWADKRSRATQNRILAAELGQSVKETQTWLRVMSEFNVFVDNIVAACSSTCIPHRAEAAERPIRIAILDDGVDSFTYDLSDKIVAGHSFCHSGTSTEMGESPHFCSAQGHGTAMAKLVCHVFRAVELVVVKLDGSHTGTPTALSAAQAINWVISKDLGLEVDIISMSWSIPLTQINKDDIPELEKAIEAAYKKNVLMFCSASDGGIDVRNTKLYPANCADKVFCIGAAKSTGQTDESVGEQSIDFTIPGTVTLDESPWPLPAQFASTALSITGSSASTALAAGLAGLVLFCVGFAGGGASYFEKLHQKAYMGRVFKRLAMSHMDHTTASGAETKLLRVKDIFLDYFRDLNWDKEGQDELDKLVKKLLRDVIDYDDRLAHSATYPHG